MTLSIDTFVDIQAPPSRVWAVLTDFAAYDSGWNPLIRSIQGELQCGARLLVQLRSPGQGMKRYAPQLDVLEPERTLEWSARLLWPGLLDSRFRFGLEPLPGGLTRFHHYQSFEGWLSFVLRRDGGRALRQGCAVMNAALKLRAEGEVCGQADFR